MWNIPSGALGRSAGHAARVRIQRSHTVPGVRPTIDFRYRSETFSEQPVNAVTIDWTGVRLKRCTYKSAAVIFSQGDSCSTVLHMERGTARLTVLSPAGNAATVALLHAGDFFGESCMAGQSRRSSSAIA